MPFNFSVDFQIPAMYQKKFSIQFVTQYALKKKEEFLERLNKAVFNEFHPEDHITDVEKDICKTILKEIESGINKLNFDFQNENCIPYTGVLSSAIGDIDEEPTTIEYMILINISPVKNKQAYRDAVIVE